MHSNDSQAEARELLLLALELLFAAEASLRRTAADSASNDQVSPDEPEQPELPDWVWALRWPDA